MDKWQAPYLEIFQSGEFDFFMEAYKALRNLNFNERAILEQGLLNQWNHLADSEWQRTYLLEPLVELKSILGADTPPSILENLGANFSIY